MTALPNRDRRAERREDTRREILDAAWAVARQDGLENVTLRAVAERVGMRAPSLYSHFESKNAIYDAMFAQGAREYLEMDAAVPQTGDTLGDLRASMHAFMAFCTENPSRYQLLFQRTIPGFEPSTDSFAVAVEGYEAMRVRLEELGVTGPDSLDLLTALGTGLANQQISNDPGGDRWVRLIDSAMEMFLAHARPTRKAPARRSR
jgi:AcrR family transcriptional regulator